MIILSILFLYFGHLSTIDRKSMNGLFFICQILESTLPTTGINLLLRSSKFGASNH